MAVQLQRGTRGRGRQPMSEINVTPMVDVMLVLLIIFMITAPLLTVGVPVDLPKTDAPQITQPSEPLVISIDKDGLIYLQESETPLENLVPRLAAITESKPDTKIFVRGDRNVDYGRIMEVMGTVASAGFAKVALIAEMPGQGGGGN
jgi:biopolymer transport protein TolR